MAVRRGAPKPDISSVEAFKRAPLDARSVADLQEGPSGVYLADLLQRLGSADQIKGKAKLADTRHGVHHDRGTRKPSWAT